MKEAIKVLRDHEDIKLCMEDTRNEILSLLMVNDMCIPKMAEALDKDHSTIYRHVKKLEDAGLVEVCDEGKHHHKPTSIYRRTADIFLLAPGYSDSTGFSLHEDLRKERIEESLDLLVESGWMDDIPPNMTDILTDFFSRLDERVASVLEKSGGETGLDLYKLHIIEMILFLGELEQETALSEKGKTAASRLV